MVVAAIDIAVQLDDTVKPEDFLSLNLELAYRAGVGPIDGVVVFNDAPLRLVGRVLADRRVIYSRDDVARVRFEVQMRARALDFEPHAAAFDRSCCAIWTAGDH